MNIIIIGDKYQKGMKSKGCPALIRYGDRLNIIEQQYSIFKKFFPNSKIIYIAGFEFKKIQLFLSENKEQDIDLIHNLSYDTYNDIYSLSLASEYLNDDVLITFGYNIFNNSTFKNFISDKGSQVFIEQASSSNIGCIIQNEVILNITYDLPNRINHLYYLRKSDAQLLHKYTKNSRHHNCFLFEALNTLIDNDCKFYPYHTTQKKSLKGLYGYNTK